MIQCENVMVVSKLSFCSMGAEYDLLGNKHSIAFLIEINWWRIIIMEILDSAGNT